VACYPDNASYTANSTTGMNYQQTKAGYLVSASTCQCIPQPSNSELRAVSVHYQCPQSEEQVVVECSAGKCDNDKWPTCSYEKRNQTMEIFEWSPWQGSVLLTSRRESKKVANIHLKKITEYLYKSCQEIKNAFPESDDGVYTIRPDDNLAPVQVYCEMTTAGGGWTVMSYLRGKEQWHYKLFQDTGVVGDTEGGFSAGGRLKQINAKYTEKLIIYLALQEEGNMLGKQWMINKRPDPVTYSAINTQKGWSYQDSFGYSKIDAGDVCSHGCSTFREFGMFADSGGSPSRGYCGTQKGDYGCRDGNNICWVPRSDSCNVHDRRCALLSGVGEGVIYAVR